MPRAKKAITLRDTHVFFPASTDNPRCKCQRLVYVKDEIENLYLVGLNRLAGDALGRHLVIGPSGVHLLDPVISLRQLKLIQRST